MAFFGTGQGQGATNKMTEQRKCNICLTEKEVGKKSVCNEIICYTCNSGFVCGDCISMVDECGSIFYDNPQRVKDAIKCPCCRTPNWNYHFNQIIGITLDSDADEGTGEWARADINKAHHIFLKNRGCEWQVEFVCEHCSATGNMDGFHYNDDETGACFCDEDCYRAEMRELYS